MNRSILLGGHPLLALHRLLHGTHLFADAALLGLLRSTLPPGARVEDAAYRLNIVVTRSIPPGTAPESPAVLSTDETQPGDEPRTHRGSA